MIKKYRKKPVEVEAIQLTDKLTGGELYRFFGYEGVSDISAREKFEINGTNIIIKTIEGDMTASNSDWIIKGIKGEFYPVKNEIFLESYEAIND